MEPKEIVRAWVDAFNRIDIDTLANFYHPDAINHQVNTVPIHGKESIRKMFEEEFSKAENGLYCRKYIPGWRLGHTGMERPTGAEGLRFLSNKK